ncbi:hypothetical protein F4821DRAFT_275548 [Hypoxylon rubiginosum]|uniref:Uncharacterized protein n=1 Tax=Hypoxylon rubiginosum TaxID=110542 RepID=A0ACC0DBV2_9PEZI|nr:hypothetical protein F4821DRAFT_275548 [Hypoxylon rubiginosum]
MDEDQKSVLYNRQINELYSRSTRRLVRRVNRSANDLKQGIQTETEHDERVAGLQILAEQNFKKIKERVDSRFGRGDPTDADYEVYLDHTGMISPETLEAGLQQLNLEAEMNEKELDQEFEDLWSESTEEPPELPPLPVPLPTLENLPNEILMNIVKQLDGPRVLKLATALPHVFLSSSKIHVIELDAVDIALDLPRSFEHPLLVYAITAGYSVSEIQRWLDIYSMDTLCGPGFINRRIPDSPYLLEAAIRVTRPEVVQLLLRRGATTKFGLLNYQSALHEAHESFLYRVRRAGAPWGNSELVERARDILVMFTLMDFDNPNINSIPPFDLMRMKIFMLYKIQNESYTRVFRNVINAIMNRDPLDPTRQFVEGVLPLIVQNISVHVWAAETRTVPGSRAETTMRKNLHRADDAIRFLMIRHRVAIEAATIANIALVNPRGANLILEATRERDASAEIFYKLFQNGAIPLTQMEDYVVDALIPLIRSYTESFDTVNMRHRLLYLAVRDKNAKIANALLTDGKQIPKQVIYHAIRHNDMNMFNKLQTMLINTKPPTVQHPYHLLPTAFSPVVAHYDEIDRLARVCEHPADVALEFHNYAMLEMILKTDPSTAKSVSITHYNDLLDAILMHSSFATVEEYRAYLNSLRGPGIKTVSSLENGIVPLADFGTFMACASDILTDEPSLITTCVAWITAQV